MKMKYIIILLPFWLIIGICKLSAQNFYKLHTTDATLTIKKGEYLEIIKKGENPIRIKTALDQLWELTAHDNSERINRYFPSDHYNFKPSDPVEIKASDNKIVLTYTNLVLDTRHLPITIELNISVKDDAFCFSGLLVNNSENWIIRHFRYPNLHKVQLPENEFNVFWPNGLGELFDENNFTNTRFSYPSSRGTMPWFSLNTTSCGLYVGCHDPLQGRKIFELSFDKQEELFNINTEFPLFQKECNIPEVMVRLYSGGWHYAAKFYRAWYDKHFKLASSPAWAMNDAGWLLAILKQQNGDVMWNYKDIDKLCDIALDHNLTTIGLFGWAIGGHDYLYPNYTPCNLMGGREELKKAIQRAHSKGVRIILYANGIMMDTSTEYFRFLGNDAAIVMEDLELSVRSIRKFHNSTPVTFAYACPGSPTWNKTMLEQALQAQSLGADGIIYDQMAGAGSLTCFSESHNHKTPYETTFSLYAMLENIRNYMNKIDPEFIIMSEGHNDAVISYFDYLHGLGMGTLGLEQTTAFPGLFRYTFPELRKTQRNSSPILPRIDANFATIYGLKHEIECRYNADVDYLLNSNIPTKESYADEAYFTPSIEELTEVSAKEAKEYIYLLIEFEKDHEEFLKFGKYIDEDGIEVLGENILAKGFLNRNRIGVIVWNTNKSEKRDFNISVPGYKLQKASEPGQVQVKALDSLNPNTIRMLIFEK